jgi:hypothetical protein
MTKDPTRALNLQQTGAVPHHVTGTVANEFGSCSLALNVLPSLTPVLK